MKRWLLLIAACASGEGPQPATPLTSQYDAPEVSTPVVDEPEPAENTTPIVEEPPVVDLPDPWQRGSTHVHAKPSGDSTMPIDGVVSWYEKHGYDFIFLTDHNRVSEITKGADTRGKIYVSAPQTGLIVLAGAELTNNPDKHCLPAGDRGKCRIHVNVLGPTQRPAGKIEWANRKSNDRLDKYQAALVEAKQLGGVVQMNHPQWFWGTTVDLVAELVRRGVVLMEVANAQFPKWNAGDATHPSTEALWDGVLSQGLMLWGVASDDAHDYSDKRGKWPAGGGWIAVRAKHDPQAILDGIVAGHFYASTGVVLEHAEVTKGELVVAVGPNETGTYVIEFIENGSIVDSVRGREAKRTVPLTGYVRAVVTRDDGKKAWVQPARHPP